MQHYNSNWKLLLIHTKPEKKNSALPLWLLHNLHFPLSQEIKIYANYVGSSHFGYLLLWENKRRKFITPPPKKIPKTSKGVGGG